MLQTLATVITAVGVLLAALALRASQRQRLRQFEAVYVERYWQLMDGLSLSAVKGEPDTDLSESDEKIIRAYLRLCEDQCEMRSAGWIGDATWRIWHQGMAEQLGDPRDPARGRHPFGTVWRQQVADDRSQLTFLQLLMVGEFDDKEPGLAKRVLNGLYGRAGV